MWLLWDGLRAEDNRKSGSAPPEPAALSNAAIGVPSPLANTAVREANGIAAIETIVAQCRAERRPRQTAAQRIDERLELAFEYETRHEDPAHG